MTLFRSIGKHRPSRLDRILADFNRDIDAERARQAGEDMPPRPAPQPPRSLGPDTVPRLFAPSEPVNPEWDPCGRPHPPLKTGSDEGGAA